MGLETQEEMWERPVESVQCSMQYLALVRSWQWSVCVRRAGQSWRDSVRSTGECEGLEDAYVELTKALGSATLA